MDLALGIVGQGPDAGQFLERLGLYSRVLQVQCRVLWSFYRSTTDRGEDDRMRFHVQLGKREHRASKLTGYLVGLENRIWE